jgi:carbon-monoxide dehydrogenase large subunit
MPRLIGLPLPRKEDRRLLTGAGRFTDDLNIPGQAYAAFVRSPHAHARVQGIDSVAALALPGVIAVLGAADYAADGCGPIAHMPNPASTLDVKQRAFHAAPGEQIFDQPRWPLSGDCVRHVGEAVAMVIARTPALARDAAELVQVDWAPLAAVATIADALAEGAPQLWPGASKNLCFSETYGDSAKTEAAIAGAAHVVRHSFLNQRIVNAQMEPRSAIGDFDPASGLCTLITGSQGVHRLHMGLAGPLQLPAEQLRVLTYDTGGGFGPRNDPYIEYLLLVWAARRLGRAVKWTADRSECFLSDYQGRDALTHATLAFDAEGHIVGYAVDWYGNVGAHTVSYVSVSNARAVLSTVYRVPAVHLRSSAVLTNTAPIAPYRGAGRPEAIHVMERLLDMAALQMGMDRIALRRINLPQRAEFPFANAMGLRYDSGDFAGNMERVLQSADWAGFAARRAQAQAQGLLAGIGLANYVEIPVGAPREQVCLCVRADGKVDLVTGTQSTGQGHETSFSQVVSDQLGVPYDSIVFHSGDTQIAKAGGGTHSDRSMRIAGELLLRASLAVIEKGRAAAAHLLEAAAADLRYEEGVYLVSGTDRSISLWEVARAMAATAPALLPAELQGELAATEDFVGRMPAYPTGAAVCELQVDPQTGELKITRYTTLDDSGKVVNPLIVDGQVHGGIVQGAGQALVEGQVYDPDSAQMQAGSFMDYAMPRADLFPRFDVELTEDPTHGTTLQVKGGGEGGCTPATATIINALCHALGVPDIEMPATPQRVWQALQRAL